MKLTLSPDYQFLVGKFGLFIRRERLVQIKGIGSDVAIGIRFTFKGIIEILLIVDSR